MTGALLLATPGDTRWVAGVAPILRDLGFDVHTDTPAPNAAADVGLVIAGAAAEIPDTLLRAWRAAGPVCAVVLPAAAVQVPGADEGVTACLREPVTEAAIVAMLARQRYLALSPREAAGIVPAIAAQTFGNRAFAAELVRALVTATQADLAKLRAADGALDTVRSVAHRLKASAHYVGCHGLCAFAQRLEHAARDGDAASAAALAAIVAPTVARLLSLLVALPSEK
ncbi:Hpt domain-containing protein [Cupriavidus sp. UYPR2.512]|uniref:Hpt domain-containing protein n=1 Tax=Cupriavidus sp. UYPR2.512 TaxID=1080187 RepID=UPI000360050E|nr:Hpt domain-containing protein [Cupriavidus sp. UYPR2.512]